MPEPNFFDQFDQAPATQARAPDPRRPGELTIQGQNIRQNDQQFHSGQTQNALNQYSLGSKPIYDRAGAVDKARDNYRQDKRVQRYESAIPDFIAALDSPGDSAGDLVLVKAFSKVTDPSTGVREGEAASVEQAQPRLDQMRAQMLKQFGSDGYGNFTPEGRSRIREALTSYMRKTADQYRLARREHLDYIGSLGIPNTDPEKIIGPFAGEPFQNQEGAYLGHKPMLNYTAGLGGGIVDASTGAPIDPRTGNRQSGAPELPSDAYRGFDKVLQPKPREDILPPHAEEFRNGLYSAMRNKQINSVADARAWVQQFNQQNGTNFNPNYSNRDTARAIRAARKGWPFDIELPRYNFDLSDPKGGTGVRGGPDNHDVREAHKRGAADTMTIGTIDKLQAGVDTIFKNDKSFNENLARQYAISDYDQEHHPWARFGGQALGGLGLPMGEMRTIPQIIAKSAALGGAYGGGSSRSLDEVPGNVALGAGGGAVVGGAVGAAGRGLGAARDFLASKLGREATPEQAAILQAADEERVPINAADVFPGLRNIVSTLETIPGASGPVRKGLRAGQDAIESRVQASGRGGTALEENPGGQVVQRTGYRYIKTSGVKFGRQYDALDKASAGIKVPATKALGTVEDVITRLAETGEINGPEIAFLQGLRNDLSKDLSIGALRRMRTKLRKKISRGELTFGEDEAAVLSIMDAASEDISNGLAVAGKGELGSRFTNLDRQYRGRMEFIQNTIQKLVGRRGQNLSPEQVFANLKSMTGPKGDEAGLGRMLQEMEPGERSDIMATFADALGKNNKGEFTLAQFTRQAERLPKGVRVQLFGPEGARSIENLITLSKAKEATSRNLNNSRTAVGINYRSVFSTLLFGLPGGGAVLGLAQAAPGTGGVIGGAVAGTALLSARVLSKALMNENFTRAILRAPATSSPKAINAHMGLLRKIASRDPNVRAVVERLEQRLLSFANDNAPITGKIAASPDEGPENQAQPQ